MPHAFFASLPFEDLNPVGSLSSNTFHVAFFGHVRGRYGNALLSRFPILATRETHVRGGSEVLDGLQCFSPLPLDEHTPSYTE